MALSNRLLQNTPTSLPRNLNRAEVRPDLVDRTEMDLLRESEPMEWQYNKDSDRLGLVSYDEVINKMLRTAPAELKDMVGKLITAGAPAQEIYDFVRKALMSPAEGQFGGSPHSEGPFWREYNQGGIVSLRHLTRPLGI